jgi:hemerythrin-like domain-containing protein
MKARKSPPNLARELARIHRVITRGLTVGVAKGVEFQKRGFQNLTIRQGYADYIHCVLVTLKVHHLAEDEIGFPFLKEKFPNAPFERLSADHQKMETLLEPLLKATADSTRDGGETALTRLMDDLRSISAIWTPHIQVEEENFSQDAVTASVDAEDQDRLSMEFGKHSRAHATPAYLVLPFILFNLNAEDRALMAAAFPWVVNKFLIPIAWKSKWAPMKPFLLE